MRLRRSAAAEEEADKKTAELARLIEIRDTHTHTLKIMFLFTQAAPKSYLFSDVQKKKKRGGKIYTFFFRDYI